MPVFFNGRLLISPTTVSAVVDSAMANQNLTVGNVLLMIGRSDGGKPNTALRFGSPAEAEAALVSGELLDAIKKAFDPSAETNAPSLVIGIRVNPATQASLALQDATPTPVINLKSTDYGQRNNQIKVKIESGTTAGKRLTTQRGNDFYTQDNVARNAFQIQYTGAQATATMSITGTTLVLSAPSGTPVATIQLSDTRTMADLVDRINVVTGFAASVLDGNDAKVPLNGLDYVTAQDVKTAAYTAKADLQAIVDWFNGLSEGFIDAERVAGVGTVPANIPFTYLAGASDGVITNTEWSNAYQVAQTVDAQWVVPISSDPAIHAMNDTHCAFMSNIGRMERRGIVGMALGSTDSAAIAAAKALNSDRTALVHIGHYDFDENSVLTLFPPYMTAAVIAGAFAGLSPGEAMTNKTIKVRGLERDVRNPTDTDPLLQGGVMPVENTPNGFKVVQSISTWLVDTKYNRREISTGVAVDFTTRNVRNALDPLRGSKVSPINVGRAKSITESALRLLSVAEPNGPGVLVGDENSPPWRNVQATGEGDVYRVQFECSPAIPGNYVLVTVYARPYSGSAQ